MNNEGLAILARLVADLLEEEMDILPPYFSDVVCAKADEIMGRMPR